MSKKQRQTDNLGKLLNSLSLFPYLSNRGVSLHLTGLSESEVKLGTAPA